MELFIISALPCYFQSVEFQLQSFLSEKFQISIKSSKAKEKIKKKKLSVLVLCHFHIQKLTLRFVKVIEVTTNGLSYLKITLL